MSRTATHQPLRPHPYQSGGVQGHVPGMGSRGPENGRGYAPVDPFKASLALGIKKVFGKTKDRTIDEIPVDGMLGRPPTHDQIPAMASAHPERYAPPDSHFYSRRPMDARPPYGSIPDLSRPYHPTYGAPPRQYAFVPPPTAFHSGDVPLSHPGPLQDSWYRAPSREQLAFKSAHSPAPYVPAEPLPSRPEEFWYRPPSRERRGRTPSPYTQFGGPERTDARRQYSRSPSKRVYRHSPPARRGRSYSPSKFSRSRSRGRGRSRSSRSRSPSRDSGNRHARSRSRTPRVHRPPVIIQQQPTAMQPPITVQAPAVPPMPQQPTIIVPPIMPMEPTMGPLPAMVRPGNSDVGIIVARSESRSSRNSRRSRSRSRSPRREPVVIVQQPPPTQQPFYSSPHVARRQSRSSRSSIRRPQAEVVINPPIMPAQGMPYSPAHIITPQWHIPNEVRRMSRSRSSSRGRSRRGRSPSSMHSPVIVPARSRSSSWRTWYPRLPATITSPPTVLSLGSQPGALHSLHSSVSRHSQTVPVPQSSRRSRRSERMSRSASPRPNELQGDWTEIKMLASLPPPHCLPTIPFASQDSPGQFIPGLNNQSTLNGGSSVDVTLFTIALSLFLDVIPRQIYLHFLLRFPALYFSRVTRIFQDANLGMGEIKRMALEAIGLDNAQEGVNRMLLYQGVFPQEWHHGAGEGTAQSVSYINLRNSWQAFIDSLMREWKTLNIISVLLLSAILTILQIESAASNLLTRFSALLSLICAFMSLIYGCLYIIRFGTMRKTHKAAEWANESERTSTSIFWNVWVMLAMPAVWLGWSMIFYIICIMSFVWQTGTVSQSRDYFPTDLDILIPRIIISCVLGLGFIYLILIGATFSRYSDPMEQAWQERIRGWLAEKAHVAAGYYHPHGHQQATGHQGHLYDVKDAAPNGFANHMSFGNTKTGQAMVPEVTLVKSVEPDASFVPHEWSGVKSKSVPNAAANPRTTPPPDSRTQKVNAFQIGVFQEKEEKVEQGGDIAPEVNPFISFVQAPRALGEIVGLGLPSIVSPSAPPPSNSIGCRGQGSAPNGLRVGPDLVNAPTQVLVPDSEHPEQSSPVNEEEPSGNRIVEVIAVPLKDASTVDGKSPALEEMQEIYKFDLRGTNTLDSEATVARDEVEEPAASTSRISNAIPIPRELLERGLASPSWGRFCEEIFSAWIDVVDAKSKALEEMVEVVDAWNGYLEPFDMFLALIQFDDSDTTQEDVTASSYSLYLGPKELVRVGVRTTGSNSRLSRLTLTGEGGQSEVHESGFPDMLRMVDKRDGVLRFSDDEHDSSGTSRERTSSGTLEAS